VFVRLTVFPASVERIVYALLPLCVLSAAVVPTVKVPVPGLGVMTIFGVPAVTLTEPPPPEPQAAAFSTT
jgi:hypothetical protein